MASRLWPMTCRARISIREGLHACVGREQWATKDFRVAARTWNEVLAGDKTDLEGNPALATRRQRLYKALIRGPAELERSNQAQNGRLRRDAKRRADEPLGGV
jgi:hypothetical protein